MKKNIKKLGIKKISVANLSTEQMIAVVAGGIERSKALDGECWYSRHRDCTLVSQTNCNVTCEPSYCYRCNI